MSRRNQPMPHHESPHELRLWAIVDSLVTDISEKEAYLAFARELMFAERRSARQDNAEGRRQKAEVRTKGRSKSKAKSQSNGRRQIGVVRFRLFTEALQTRAAVSIYCGRVRPELQSALPGEQPPDYRGDSLRRAA
jgi:hypothetical protein